MVNKSSYQKRKINNIIALSLASFATVLGIFFLFWILGILLFNGLSHISWEIFSVDGAPPGIEPSGLRHALVGHLMLTVSSTMIGVPMGLLAGTYLSEYGANSRFANFTRDISDIMMSAPSIIIGVFVYGILVMPFKQFSGWAGSIALAIIMIPVIIRTTDDMLALVPRELREA
ncbi:MAG: ABC transporter permease subunit, partial [Sulfurospirillum cavolei]|nr:ABC transporter permease subunit [Sulfurospirillum cavolei]